MKSNIDFFCLFTLLLQIMSNPSSNKMVIFSPINNNFSFLTVRWIISGFITLHATFKKWNHGLVLIYFSDVPQRHNNKKKSAMNCFFHFNNFKHFVFLWKNNPFLLKKNNNQNNYFYNARMCYKTSTKNVQLASRLIFISSWP